MHTLTSVATAIGALAGLPAALINVVTALRNHRRPGGDEPVEPAMVAPAHRAESPSRHQAFAWNRTFKR